ncbi:alcohol dehydrogenase catalytic domain-containing protein [Streptomyces sp. NPDC054840]
MRGRSSPVQPGGDTPKGEMEERDAMEALVFQGSGQTAWQDVPDPGIEDTADATFRVDDVTIRGTDLHVVKGDVPEGTPGRILGHEAVGTSVETGGDVPTVRPGTACSFPASRPAAAAASASRATAASTAGAAAGCWAHPLTGTARV